MKGKIETVLCKESEIVSAIKRCYEKAEDGEIVDDLSLWVGSKNEEGEEDWVKKMSGGDSQGKSVEIKNLDDSYYLVLRR